MIQNDYKVYAAVAELVDAPDLGSQGFFVTLLYSFCSNALSPAKPKNIVL